MEENELLFALLRIAVCGEPARETVKAACTPEMLEKVYALADRHDLAHLVGQGASKLNLPESQILSKCKHAAAQAFARYMWLSRAYDQTCTALEEAKIPFIPLKGSVLRNYYPEPWMRTSCDIDILVREEMLDDAVKVLTQKLDYVAGSKGNHDIPLHSASGVHLELHYDTIHAHYDINGCRNILGQIWEHAQPREPGSVHYLLSDPMFYFYHIAHMAKHFTVGGCGIRTFLDIWILNQKVEHDPQLREDMLRAGGLLKFAQEAQGVAEFWFCGERPNTLTKAISDYILRAGIYGDDDNRAALGQAKTGGKGKHLLRKVFKSYNSLKTTYPILNTHKWLTPVYQVVRWYQLLSHGKMRRIGHELKANINTNQANVSAVSDMLKELEL